MVKNGFFVLEKKILKGTEHGLFKLRHVVCSEELKDMNLGGFLRVK